MISLVYKDEFILLWIVGIRRSISSDSSTDGVDIVGIANEGEF